MRKTVCVNVRLPDGSTMFLPVVRFVSIYPTQKYALAEFDTDRECRDWVRDCLPNKVVILTPRIDGVKTV